MWDVGSSGDGGLSDFWDFENGNGFGWGMVRLFNGVLAIFFLRSVKCVRKLNKEEKYVLLFYLKDFSFL